MRLSVTLFLLAALPIGSAISQQTQQIPIPPQNSSNTSVVSEGFWFSVPANGSSFDITGLRMFDVVGLGVQHVAVKRFTSSPPSGAGTLLFAALNRSSASIVPCSVAVQPGDVICVLGECSVNIGFGWLGNNSRGIGGFASNAAGNPVTLYGCSSSSLPASGTGNGVIDQGSSYLGRVEVYVRATGNLASKQRYGSGCLGLSHDATSRPVIGSSFDLVTSGIGPSVNVGATILGLTRYDPGIELTSIGLTGCFQYTSFEVVELWAPNASRMGVTPFGIPNNPVFAGVDLCSQALAIQPGANPVGAITSNGLLMHIDVN